MLVLNPFLSIHPRTPACGMLPHLEWLFPPQSNSLTGTPGVGVYLLFSNVLYEPLQGSPILFYVFFLDVYLHL